VLYGVVSMGTWGGFYGVVSMGSIRWGDGKGFMVLFELVYGQCGHSLLPMPILI